MELAPDATLRHAIAEVLERAFEAPEGPGEGDFRVLVHTAGSMLRFPFRTATAQIVARKHRAPVRLPECAVRSCNSVDLSIPTHGAREDDEDRRGRR